MIAALNPDTIVSVHGYAGDANQISLLLPYYGHHECPVIIVSPTDSPIRFEDRPGLSCVQAGLRAYIGQVSLDRQKLQMQLLLRNYPHRWFLMNDSDSVCLSAKLPDYLYERNDVLWSNIVSDATVHPMADRLKAVPNYDFPQLAFQPPYFLHRSAMERLVQVADVVPGDPRTPFIDWCMMAWAVKSGVQYAGFREGASCGTNTPHGLECMLNTVRHEGKFFLHSVKTPSAFGAILQARKDFLDTRSPRGDTPVAPKTAPPGAPGKT